MGNKGNKSEVVDNQEEIINHPRISNVTIKKTNKDHSYMETNIPIIDKKDYDAWKKALKHSPGQHSPYALHPRKHDLKTDKTCGKSGTAKVEYDNYSYTLKDEIRNRQKSGMKKFQETEIWYLLNSLSDVADKFHDKKRKVGDIRPENVFINDEGNIKVATQDSWPKENTNYEKFFYDKQPTLLAPEELNDAQVGRNTPTANLQTAESFSIGMTALDSAMLDESEKLYNKNAFDYDGLDYKRRNFFNEPKYSELLKIVIGNLTSPQYGKRLTPSELKDFLKPNEGRITALQNFSVNDIPNKLKQTAQEIKLPSAYQTNQQSIYAPKSEYMPNPSMVPRQISTSPSHFNPTSTYRVSSMSPRGNTVEGQGNYRMTLAEIEEKVAKSRAMNP